MMRFTARPSKSLRKRSINLEDVRATDGAEAVMQHLEGRQLFASVSLAAIQDAYVRDGTYAGRSSGSEAVLHAKADSVTSWSRQSYVTFDTSGVAGAATKAVLRLYGRINTNVSPSSTVAVSLLPVASTTWSENTLNWNNKPSASGSAVATKVVSAVNQWVEWDVSSYVAAARASGAPRVSFSLVAGGPSPTVVQFNSAEAASNRPALVLTTGAVISPPTVPGPTAPPAGVGSTVKINFQPATAPTIAGYLPDAGATFGARNGQTYGWSTSHTDAVVDRNKNPNQLLDTNVGVKQGGKWELVVPNGQYTVKVGVGDAAVASQNNVWIEGVQLFNYQALGINAFTSKSLSVTVTDGRLTLGIGSAATGKTRVDYVEVSGLSTSPPPTSPPPTSPPPTSPPPTAPPTTGSAKVNFQPASAPAVAGYAIDSGAVYGARNVMTYGWTVSHTDSVADRNKNTNQLLDTSVGVKQGAKWEMAVPSGTYTVKLSVGDAAVATQNNVWIEGVQLFNYQSQGVNVFASKSLSVKVSDGRLTVAIGSAATGKTRLDFIEVAGLPVSPPPVVVPPVVSPPIPPIINPQTDNTPTLRPAAAGGMSVEVSAGKVLLPNGTLVEVAGGTLSFDAPAILHGDVTRTAPPSLPVTNDGRPYSYLARNIRPPGMKWASGGLRHLVLPETVVVKNAAGRIFQRDIDYKLNEEWGQIMSIGDRLGTPEVAQIVVSFDYVLQRMDLVQVLPNGTLTVKKGVGVPTVPQLPAPDAGAFALAGIHVSSIDGAVRTGYELKSRDIYPIQPAAPVPLVNPSAVSKTLAKLKAGASVTIAHVGDSVTAGGEVDRSVDRSETYTGRVTNVLKQRFPTAAVNEIGAYQPGVAASQAGALFTKNVIDPHVAGWRKTDLVMFGLGLCDWERSPGDDFKAIMTGYVQQAKSLGIEVVLLTPLQSSPAFDALNSSTYKIAKIAQDIRDIAAAEQVALVDVFAEWGNQATKGISPYSQLHNTFNHPDEVGMKVYSDAILGLFPTGNAAGLPATPSTPVVQAARSRISLTWPAVASATSYDVYRVKVSEANAGAPYKRIYTGLKASVYVDFPGDKELYRYRVVAVNAAGESAPSASVDVAVSDQPVVAPANPLAQAVQISAGSVLLPSGARVNVASQAVNIDPVDVQSFTWTGAAPGNYGGQLLVRPWPDASIGLVPPVDTRVLGGSYHAIIPESVVVQNAITNEIYVRDVDYKLNTEWGQIMNLDSRLGAAKTGSLRITYTSTLQRLDLIQVLSDGTVNVKKGTPSAVMPLLPSPDAGAVGLAGIHSNTIDGAKTSDFRILARDIYTIKDVPPVPIVNPSAIPNTLAKLRAGGAVNIGYFGDSITAGAEAANWFNDPSKKFTSLVTAGVKAKFPQATVKETLAHEGGVSALNGENTFQTLIMNPHNAGNRVDLLIIAMGMNDLGKPTLTPFKDKIKSYIDRARAAGMEVLLVTPMQSNPYYDAVFTDWVPRAEIAQALREVAAERNATLADVFTEWMNQANKGIAPVSQLHNWLNHPGTPGHKLYADTILRAFPV